MDFNNLSKNLIGLFTHLGIKGFFGVQTTASAASLAAVGFARGIVWGNLHSNFISKIPSVITIPKPDVEILQFTELHPVLAVELFLQQRRLPASRRRSIM